MKKIFQKIKLWLFPRHFTSKEFCDFCIPFVGEVLEERSTEVINNLYKKLTGREIGGKLSSYEMFWFLLNRKKWFQEVAIPEPGVIIISPTGLSKDKTAVGNVGVVSYENQVFSVDPSNLKFDNHHTIDTWIIEYQRQGFPVLYFKLI